VLTKESALRRASGATSVYLDLSRHAADQAKGSTPFTLPTHVTRAFDEALAELADEGGWKKRHATYQARSSRVRSVCRESNAHLLLERVSVSSSRIGRRFWNSWTYAFSAAMSAPARRT